MYRDETSQHCSFVQLFIFFVKTIWAKKIRENSEFVFRENIGDEQLNSNSSSFNLEAAHHHMLSRKTNSEFSQVF